MVDFSKMAKIIVMVVIGGLGFFTVPILAAPVINFLTTYLQAWGEWSLVIFAGVVILVMRSYPGGLSGVADAVRRVWRDRLRQNRN
jgi:branched-chain amino acid transport system permease protein